MAKQVCGKGAGKRGRLIPFTAVHNSVAAATLHGYCHPEQYAVK